MSNSSDDRSTAKRWTAYYDRFPYITESDVRDGCHPKVMAHDAPADKAIVLTHGLTDSPHFLTAIARYFHDELGFDVYLPLLHCHGLKEPNGMEGVELEEWKANVRFAIKCAAEKAPQVSVGGLSTGGTLSFYMACTKPKVTGDLYLFSSALDLAGGPLGLIGDMKERLLRTFLADVLDNDKPLIGENPYRYCRMDLDGAQELARLIKETDDLLKGFDRKNPFPKRVFAAHSEFDTTADLRGVQRLQGKTAQNRFTLFQILEKEKVRHASLVLKDPIFASGAEATDAPLEKANPKFGEMMAAIAAFQQD